MEGRPQRRKDGGRGAICTAPMGRRLPTWGIDATVFEEKRPYSMKTSIGMRDAADGDSANKERERWISFRPSNPHRQEPLYPPPLPLRGPIVPSPEARDPVSPQARDTESTWGSVP